MNRLACAAATLFTLLAGLTGCTTPATSSAGPPRSPAYNAGFNDGCESGKASQNVVAGRYRQDSQRFASDKQYADGWTSGHNKCADEQIQRNAGGK